MIIKAKTKDGMWKFIDKVDSAVAGRDGPNGERYVDYVRNGEDYFEDIQSGAFLMSDSGKTIERLA